MRLGGIHISPSIGQLKPHWDDALLSVRQAIVPREYGGEEEHRRDHEQHSDADDHEETALVGRHGACREEKAMMEGAATGY